MPGTNGFCGLAGLQGKCRVFQLLRQLATGIFAKVAALRSSRATRVRLRQVLEARPRLELGVQIVCLGFGGSQVGRFVASRRHRDENLAQPHRLGLREIVQVLPVILLQLGIRHLNTAAYLVADHLLGDDAVADVLLEILVGDALA